MTDEQLPLARAPGGLTVEDGHRPRTVRLENVVEPRHVTASLVALAAVAGLIAGCGGSDPSPTTAQSGGSQPSGGSGSVTISNFKFAPASVTVSRNTRISVTNHDSTAHTATADDGQSFDTGNIDPNASATVTLAKAGTYKYHCSIHPFMHGTLVVR
jgi:plastocyanin